MLNSLEVARKASCIFNYQRGRGGEDLPTKSFTLRPDRLFVTSKLPPDGLDFTFVAVDGSPGDEFGFITLNRQAPAVKEGDFANIVQHPSGRRKCVALQDNQCKKPGVNAVHYTSDTEPGSSGSPVFDNAWRIFALHHASTEAADGLSVAGKSGRYVNEGMLISAIATYLEGRRDDRGAQEVLGAMTGVDFRSGFFGALGRPGDGEGRAPEIVTNAYKGEAGDIDVGFWNIEWFNKRYEDEGKLEGVAKVIVSMNLDVWCFEESSKNSVQALVHFLGNQYGLKFEMEASEPSSPDSKQATAVMWNPKTVDVKKRPWPGEIEHWFKVHSSNFDDLGLEAVDGKVFDRYPALYHVTAKDTPVEAFDFYVVPVHLKAMAEGSKRRRMASRILAAAIQRMIEDGADQDWVLGGDFNAPLISEDFAALSDGGAVAISAADEDQGAFTYVKKPKSLIDHVFLSPNLAKTYGADDFFIVTKDRVLPGYVKKISDHRPVLVRLSLKQTPESRRNGRSAPKDLLEMLARISGARSRPGRAP